MYWEWPFVVNVIHNIILGRIYDPFQAIMNDKSSQFSIMNDTVNNKKCHNIVNDNSIVHKPDGLLVSVLMGIMARIGLQPLKALLSINNKAKLKC